MITALSMATFLGIVWWAWSRHRQPANAASALLPFALPDEGAEAAPAQPNVSGTP
ncbi:MAG: CcoQ/FixQ family Cbb3-type cytochrome c oxidase assembly chaperone [Bordetella sp.]|nr:CcoQ/FixQ family Cbb3-type cytochrome c oxidase assembly chaperone [Bordetella sp.]